MKKTNTFKKALIYIIIGLLSITFILPFIWMLRSSLMELQQIFIMPPQWIPNPVKLENYIHALTIVPFALYFKNTMIILILGMVGTLITSTLSAYSFARLRWKGRDFWFKVILTSMMLPGAVTLIPQFLGWNALGMVGSFVPLIVPAFFGGGAFNIFLLRQFYMSIPLELDEAAIVDGASFFRIYTSIILPLSRSAIIVIAIFSFMFYWNDFMGPLIYLTDESKYTLAIGLQMFQGAYNTRWEELMAASTSIILPCVLIFIIGQKYFLEGITMSGLKG
ncbi:carbohydrate ABC transporter permease [Ruminiclostridium cellobioparum]|uniref:ABC-type sugar transport system, permease component n=1 Tax=Ruminiclostridium cellobioparum subsp. termitidis CT1112 TaxID=1195236 RepID=S0FN10_RUMCE|nr:carbohydrate ABC transporter permease [Ruminiclostridium cellobioparum]EMS73625.1 ABC-type sugar transport system, permease component [Ruminiclostridium cellobioparum subsp. termitidis CT1112]